MIRKSISRWAIALFIGSAIPAFTDTAWFDFPLSAMGGSTLLVGNNKPITIESLNKNRQAAVTKALQERAAAERQCVAALLHADKAEIAVLHSIANNPTGPGGVSTANAARRLVGKITARYGALTPATPLSLLGYFQTVSFQQPMSIKTAVINRNSATRRSLREWSNAQQRCHRAILAADEQEIAAINTLIKRDRRDQNTLAIANDIAASKVARADLNADSANNPVSSSPLFPSRPDESGTLGAVPQSQWPGLVAKFSQKRKGISNLEGLLKVIFPKLPRATAAELPASARALNLKLIRKPVIVNFRVRSVVPATNGYNIIKGRLFWREQSHYSRHQVSEIKAVRAWYGALYRAGRLRQQEEHAAALQEQKNLYPNAVEWQVPKTEMLAEVSERRRFNRQIGKLKNAALRIIAGNSQAPWQRVRIYSKNPVVLHWEPRQTHAAFGVVVGVAPQAAEGKALAVTLPSGLVFTEQGALGYRDFSLINAVSISNNATQYYLQSNVRIVWISSKIPTPPAALGPITGYVFHLNTGTTMTTKHYTKTGNVYHLSWHGMTMDVFSFEVKRIEVKHAW